MTQQTLDSLGSASKDAGTVTCLGGEAERVAVPRVNVVGVDLSLTSTGLACMSGVATVQSEGKTGATWQQRQRRLHRLRNDVLQWCRPATLVVIEGPSYASVGGSQHDRSGLWWMVVDRLLANDIPVAVMSPKGRAKYCTGNGNAGKDQCMLAAVRRWPMFDITGNDIADAVTLMAAGLDWLEHPLVEMPAANRTALNAVAWPDLVTQ